MQKKASLLDFFYIIVILFIISIITFAGLMVTNEVEDSGLFSSNANAEKAITITKNTLLSFDDVLLFIIVGLSLYVIISSAIVWTHPAFFFIGLLLLSIAVTVSGIASNTFWTFSTDATISAVSADFPKIVWLMERLPFYIAIMGLVTLTVGIVSYSRQ